jgi:hypothetical protein
MFPIGLNENDAGKAIWPTSFGASISRATAAPSSETVNFPHPMVGTQALDARHSMVRLPNKEDLWIEQHRYELYASVLNYSNLRNLRIIPNPAYNMYPYYGTPTGFFRELIEDNIEELVELHWKSDNPYFTDTTNVLRIASEKYDVMTYQGAYQSIFDNAAVSMYPIDPRRVLAVQRSLVTRVQSTV